MNLLSNACKFTQDGTIKVNAWTVGHEEIEKKAASLIPDERDTNGRVYISVEDSGCGMSLADTKKLFKDFSTLKSNAHLNPNGVGLGLSICRKICHKLNGDISVRSQVNKGTKFTFYVTADFDLGLEKGGHNNLPGSIIESKGSKST